MKKLTYVAAFLFSLAASGVVAAAAPSDWEVFSPKGEKFSISFPTTPATQTKVMPSPLGDMHMTMYMDMVESTGYFLAVIDVPADARDSVKDNPEAALDGVALGFVKGAKGKVTSQKDIKVNGYAGRDIEGTVFNGNGALRCQVILTKDRLYLVMVMSPASTDLGDDANAFLNSFSLKEKASKD